MDNMQLEKELKKVLAATEKEMEEIAGSWNGDNAGSAEDRAHQANDIIGSIHELRELLSGLDEL